MKCVTNLFLSGAICIVLYGLTAENSLAELPERPMCRGIREIENSEALEKSLRTLQTLSRSAQNAQSSGVTARAGTVTTLHHSGPSENRLDIVFIGEGYTEQELSGFAEQVNYLMPVLLNDYPLREYSSYINIHRVDVASNESGIDADYFPEQMPDTALDGNRCGPRSICVDTDKTREYAAAAPGADLIIVLANTQNYGGSGYLSGVATLSAGNIFAPYIMLHEIGHSLAQLADEYDNDGEEQYTGTEEELVAANVSTISAFEMSAAQVKWWRWLGEPAGGVSPLPVWTFEGAMYHRLGIFRPTESSRMRNLQDGFNVIGNEQVLNAIYLQARAIDSAPADVLRFDTDVINITPMRPLTHALTIRWYVDGVQVPESDGQTWFLPHAKTVTPGEYNIQVQVSDDTALVRSDDVKSTMWDTRIWGVVNVESPFAAAPVITRQPKSVYARAGKSPTFSVRAKGRRLSYQWYRNGVPIPGAVRSSLQLRRVSYLDSYAKYWVVVRNKDRSVVSTQALLAVY